MCYISYHWIRLGDLSCLLVGPILYRGIIWSLLEMRGIANYGFF